MNYKSGASSKMQKTCNCPVRMVGMRTKIIKVLLDDDMLINIHVIQPDVIFEENSLGVALNRRVQISNNYGNYNIVLRLAKRETRVIRPVFIQINNYSYFNFL